MGRYTTLFRGTLVQASALNISGDHDGFAVEDSPFFRDGAGRLTVRGTGLAGALLSTLRRIQRHIPDHISGGATKRDLKRSRWKFHHAHCAPDTRTELRTGVGIRQDTGARAHGVLYDVEVTPRGTSWDFLMEVDTFDPDGTGAGADAERLAAAALLEWSRGRAWLGGDVARGLGWVSLRDLEALRLDTSAVDLWPDNSKEPREILADLPDEWVPAAQFEQIFAGLPVSDRWGFMEITARIQLGLRDDGYGLETLAVSGNSVPELFWESVENIDRPKDLADLRFAPDATIAMSRSGPEKAAEPLIPGSSLRGPLRHALSRGLRRRGVVVSDPNAMLSKKRGKERDPVERLFGTLSTSSALLVRDAHLDPNTPDWRGVWLQHHAANDFTSGVYKSAKYDRLVLTEGVFAVRMVIDAPLTLLHDSRLHEALAGLRKTAENGHLPIGARKTSGNGWPAWAFDPPVFYRAGSAEPEPLTGVTT